MNRRFSKALALLMAVSLCATPAFANTITYDPNLGTDASVPAQGMPPASTMDSGNSWTKPTDPTRKGYTFKGWSRTTNGNVLPEYTYDSGADVTFYAIWEKEATPEATVTGIKVKTQPTKTTYTEGDELDLTDLVVTLTMSDGKTIDVQLADFTKNNITTVPADKAVLKSTDTTVAVSVKDVATPATFDIKVLTKVTVTVDKDAPNDFKGEDKAPEVGIELEDGEEVFVSSAETTTATETKEQVTQAVTAIEGIKPAEGNDEPTQEQVKEALTRAGFDAKKAPAIKSIKTNNVFSFSITVKKGGTTVNKEGDVNVTIPLPDIFKDAKNLLAIHYHDGKKILLPASIQGTKVNIVLTGLSDIALVEYEPAEESGGDEPGTDEPSNPGTSSDDRYVAYNPGGSSGGSGGGGGGSSSSNRGTSMFNSLTNTINGILKSQLSKGTVGAASAVTGTATASVSTPATQAAATRAISQAVSKARANGSNSAEAIMQNVSVVSASILESIAAEARKSGVNAYLSVDTMKNGIVDVRVRIPVSAASRLGRDVNMASVDNTAVKARFNRYYSNRLDVVALAQNGSFGVPASVAARLALGNANAADLHFYSFNAATNSYQEMVQTGAFIDVNGYLHFNTELGGYIIVSVGTLELK